jgi:OmpA family protein
MGIAALGIMRTTTLAAILFIAALGTPVVAGTQTGEIKFDFDSAKLPASAVDSLADVVAAAKLKPDARIVLDAHCDPVGTGPYNIHLAIRRAEAVRYGLMADGVDPARIVFAVYGKDGAQRATHAGDRRVGLTLTTDPIASVIDETFDGRGTAVTWQRPLTLAQIRSPSTGAISSR